MLTFFFRKTLQIVCVEIVPEISKKNKYSKIREAKFFKTIVLRILGKVNPTNSPDASPLRDCNSPIAVSLEARRNSLGRESVDSGIIERQADSEARENGGGLVLENVEGSDLTNKVKLPVMDLLGFDSEEDENEKNESESKDEIIFENEKLKDNRENNQSQTQQEVVVTIKDQSTKTTNQQTKCHVRGVNA